MVTARDGNFQKRHREVGRTRAAYDQRIENRPGLPEPSVIADAYVIVRRENEVLLLHRTGTGYKDDQWGPPSGKVEAGETFSEAAVRELAEETGIDVSPRDLRLLHVLERVPTSGAHWVGMFFEVHLAGVVPVNREPHKHGALNFFPACALPDSTVDYVRHVLDVASRGEHYSEWKYPADEDGP